MTSMTLMSRRLRPRRGPHAAGPAGDSCPTRTTARRQGECIAILAHGSAERPREGVVDSASTTFQLGTATGTGAGTGRHGHGLGGTEIDVAVAGNAWGLALAGSSHHGAARRQWSGHRLASERAGRFDLDSRLFVRLSLDDHDEVQGKGAPEDASSQGLP